MEPSLQTESFSYTWVPDFKPSSTEDSLIDEASFIEMDPRLPPSKRFIGASSDFGFDFPVSESPLDLVHADELFSNGFIVPLIVKDTKMKRFEGEDYYMPTAFTSHTTTRRLHSPRRCLRRCRRLSKRFFHKYFNLLRNLLYKWRRENSDVAAEIWELSAATSPRISAASSGDENWRRSCDSESSIYEAVLHCKRTHGK